MGRFNEAVLDFQKALALSPSFDEAEKALRATEKALSDLAIKT